MNNNEYVEIDNDTVNIVDRTTKNLISIINNNEDLINILKTQEWRVNDEGDVVADDGKMLNGIVWNFFRVKKH
jgi:predicted P-loop ATPase